MRAFAMATALVALAGCGSHYEDPYEECAPAGATRCKPDASFPGGGVYQKCYVNDLVAIDPPLLEWAAVHCTALSAATECPSGVCHDPEGVLGSCACTP
jgi:hypothetical protein